MLNEQLQAGEMRLRNSCSSEKIHKIFRGIPFSRKFSSFQYPTRCPSSVLRVKIYQEALGAGALGLSSAELIHIIQTAGLAVERIGAHVLNIKISKRLYRHAQDPCDT